MLILKRWLSDKASDHIINDEEAADLSIEIEKNVEAINLKSKPEAMNSIVTKQLDSSKSTDVSVDLVNEKTVQGTNGGRPSLNSNLGNPVLSVSKPELKATFENRFVEKKFTVGAEGFCPVVVSTVKSPGLFYVHLITPDVKLFGEMIYQLDQCYSNNGELFVCRNLPLCLQIIEFREHHNEKHILYNLGVD